MQNERIRIAPKHEYAITVEQITVRFLINGINNHREMDGVHEQMLRTNLHTHAYGEMFLCHKKAARVNFAQGFITLEPGDLLYVPANVPHVCAINESETGPLAFGIQFTRKGNPESHGLQKFLSPLSDSAQSLILRQQPETVQSWDMLLRTEPDIDPAVFALQMLALLTHTDPGMFSTLPGSSGYTEFEHNSNVKRIADLEYIIDSQFMTPLHRTAIAEKLFISTRQLERICKKRFGKTFREQVEERRMNAAVQMLKETGHTAETISHLVGFSSKSSFYQAFHKKYGMTPHQYRKELKR